MASGGMSQILIIRRILEVVLAKNLDYLLTLPRPPFTGERWSKFYLPTAYQKKPLQP